MEEQDLGTLKTFPEKLEKLLRELHDTDSPVREGAWNPTQYIHHLAEAQTVYYFRMKWIVTEDKPTLIGFDQNKWTEETPYDDIDTSLMLLKSIYNKTFNLLDNLSDDDWNKKGNHAELGDITIRQIFEAFIDHGNSHLKQVEKWT